MNEKFNELLKELKGLGEITSCGDFIEDLPNEVYEKHFKADDNYEEVANGLDVDTHRWYETSTSVIKIYGHYLGINQVSNTFSESMGYEDCGVTIGFFEMEEKQTVTYVAK